MSLNYSMQDKTQVEDAKFMLRTIFVVIISRSIGFLAVWTMSLHLDVCFCLKLCR